MCSIFSMLGHRMLTIESHSEDLVHLVNLANDIKHYC